MEEKNVRVAYRVTKERSKELRQYALDHDTSIQELLDGLVETLLNPEAFTETVKTSPIIDGQRRISVHNNPMGECVHYAQVVVDSGNHGTILALAQNLQQFLFALMAITEMEKDGVLHAKDIPVDYAAEARRAGDTLERLRRLFATDRKAIRSIPRKAKT